MAVENGDHFGLEIIMNLFFFSYTEQKSHIGMNWRKPSTYDIGIDLAHSMMAQKMPAFVLDP